MEAVDLSTFANPEGFLIPAKIKWENPTDFRGELKGGDVHFAQMGNLGVAIEVWTGNTEYGSRIFVFSDNPADIDKLGREIDAKIDTGVHDLTDNEKELQSVLFALGTGKKNDLDFAYNQISGMTKLKNCLVISKGDAANASLHRAIPVLVREKILPEGIENLIPKS